jgi:hypothetical protein
MIIQVFQIIANTNSLLVAALMAEMKMMSAYLINQRMQHVESFSDASPADLWFGCTDAKLYTERQAQNQELR